MTLEPQAALTENVRQLIADALQIPVEQVVPDLAFGDLPQWDSMGHMEVMMLLEERYGIEINADTIAGLTSIPVMCAAIAGGGHA